jgi:hypothetical protein
VAAGQRRKKIEGRQHGGRRRIVRIVQDRKVGHAHQLVPMRSLPATVKPGRDLLQIKPSRDTDGRRGQSIVDAVAAEGRRDHVDPSAGRD